MAKVFCGIKQLTFRPVCDIIDLDAVFLEVLSMELNFCTQCGRKLVLKPVGDEGDQKYCTECNRYYFDNPASCVLVAIINERNEVLLLKQNYISQKHYTLCSGYLKKGETLEETVVREVFEETGQRVISCEYVQSYYFPPMRQAYIIASLVPKA